MACAGVIINSNRSFRRHGFVGLFVVDEALELAD